ncbi:MAG TPA: exonuclease domain-containing protein [Burkholderiales bacterium]|nr:exonuclease domain-containing protein [Burkholderiales bacterium]
MLDRSLVFLDLETTGAGPHFDRITEIGLVEVDRGRLVGEWSSLVNPLRRIPPEIQNLTGITDEMVAGAPSFDQLAPDLYARLQGKVLVAHNARFDYGFLRHEFRRAGYRYVANVLCTVKLSRRLYPHERKHNLDSLIERHGLVCNERHRALADARVLWDFTQRVHERLGPDLVRSEVEKLLRPPVMPPGLEPDALEDIPDAAGVYVFYAEADTPLYVGKTGNLRTRVLGHLEGDARRDREIARRVRRIDWLQTAGEFGAAIRDARLLRRLQPAYNRKPGSAETLSFRWNPVDGPNRPTLVEVSAADFAQSQDLFGLFRSKAVANNALRGLADEHGLCLIALGLDAGKGPCYNYPLKRCRGLCAGKETERAHTARLAAALAPLRIQCWPFTGRIGVRETDPFTGQSQVHVFDRWTYLGSAREQTDLDDALETRLEPGFDMDTYKLLLRVLKRPPANIRIFELEVADDRINGSN